MRERFFTIHAARAVGSRASLFSSPTKNAPGIGQGDQQAVSNSALKSNCLQTAKMRRFDGVRQESGGDRAQFFRNRLRPSTSFRRPRRRERLESWRLLPVLTLETEAGCIWQNRRRMYR